MLTVGGLFSGIGGWELGLERAGMRVLWHCEADDYAAGVLKKHWPGLPTYPDVRDLCGRDDCGSGRECGRPWHPERVDVLCGGFPCQDISVAGRGAGIDGARSGLWSEYARLVGELRPRYVLVENVAALLGRGLGVVLGDLAALGYDAEWDCLPAVAFGAPHRRDRLFLVAYPNERWGLTDRRERHEVGRREDARRNGSQGPLADADEQRRQGRTWELGPSGRAESAYRREDVAHADSERFCADARPGHDTPRLDSSGGQSTGWWATEPDVGRVAHGVPARLDRLAALGNALVPQIAEWIGRRIIDFEEGQLAA